MTRFDDKAELYAVVSDLRARDWTIPTIALAVGCTDTHIRNILTNMGIYRSVRYSSTADALASLDDNLAARVRALRQFVNPTSGRDDEPDSA